MYRFRVRASKSMTEPMLLRPMPIMKPLNQMIKFQRQLVAQISSHLKEADAEVAAVIEVIVVDAVDVEDVVAMTIIRERTSRPKMVVKMVTKEVKDATTIDATTKMVKEETTVVEVIVIVEIETNKSLSTMRKKKKAGLSVNSPHKNMKPQLKMVKLSRVREVVVVADVAVEIVVAEVVAEIAKDNNKETTSNIIILILAETSTLKWLTNRKMARKSTSTTETSANTTRMAST